MKLKELLQGLELLEVCADPEMELTGVCYDSRQVQPGNVFVAISGFAADGHSFIPMALEKGASVIFCERVPEQSCSYVLLKNTRKALALAGANWYGHPAEKMIMIGVTGTNGKTTSTYLLKHILEKTIGAKVGLIGTIQNMIGDEMLYTENHRYLSDLLSYTAVGARSSEDQQHRLTASGLDIPVGMKNPMSGDLTSMLNSISAAQHPHTFIYRGWEVKSKGNPLAHAILRGYVNKEGESTPNYHYEDLVNLEKLYTNDNYQNPSIIVDTNHSNSNKNYLEQINIALDVISSMNKNDKLKKIIKGLMIESYIEDGCQNIDGGVYGKSITDPCLGIEKTEKLILDIYNLRKVNR